MKMRDQVLARQTIVVKTEEWVSFLGPGLVLDHCDVVLKCSAGSVGFTGVEMQGGTFTATRRLVNCQFSYMHFRGVKFAGAYSGCDFGYWDSPEKSSIADCDFAGAYLDGCRFLSCDTDAIVFPHWPCVTIITPSIARESIMAVDWPGRVAQLLDVYTDNDPECVACTFDASRVAQKYGIALEEFKPLLLAIPFMKISEAGPVLTTSVPK